MAMILKRKLRQVLFLYFSLFFSCNSPSDSGQRTSHLDLASPLTKRLSSFDKTEASSQAKPPKQIKRSPAELTCRNEAFESSVKLAEASGATMLDDESVLVVGDSGTHGAYVILDARTGKVKNQGNLKLDSVASDDLEGITSMDSRIYGITSSGWMREWTYDNKFTLVRESYSLAPENHPEYTCEDPKDSNCAKNYEGLCFLSTRPTKGQCVGFAASKATGELICIEENQKGQLTFDPERRIKVSSPRTLSGCNFDEFGLLWFGNNFFAGNIVGFIKGWKDLKTANITSLGPMGVGFTEALTVGKSGQVFRFSDTGGSPSLLSKYICH